MAHTQNIKLGVFVQMTVKGIQQTGYVFYVSMLNIINVVYNFVQIAQIDEDSRNNNISGVLKDLAIIQTYVFVFVQLIQIFLTTKIVITKIHSMGEVTMIGVCDASGFKFKYTFFQSRVFTNVETSGVII